MAKDPAGSVAGISPKTLRGLQKKYGIPEYDLDKLTTDQAVNVYKTLENEYTKSKGLESIGDSNVAAQYFDVRFQHASYTPTGIFRKAITSVISQPNFPELAKENVMENINGGGTDYMRKYVIEFVATGHADDLVKAVTNKRNDFFIENYGENKGSNYCRTYGYLLPNVCS